MKTQQRKTKAELVRLIRVGQVKNPRSVKSTRKSIKDTAAFGMWAEREDMQDPTAYVRSLRQPRF